MLRTFTALASFLVFLMGGLTLRSAFNLKATEASVQLVIAKARSASEGLLALLRQPTSALAGKGTDATHGKLPISVNHENQKRFHKRPATASAGGTAASWSGWPSWELRQIAALL